MTIKEIEEIKKKDKQRQQRNVICHKRDGIVTIGEKMFRERYEKI